MTYTGYYNCVNAFGIYTQKIEAAVAGKLSAALSSSQPHTHTKKKRTHKSESSL